MDAAIQTALQEMQRGLVDQLETGAALERVETLQRIAVARGLPRDNH